MSRTHQELREALGAYALDQLDAELRADVDVHLATCDACRDELAAIVPVAEGLRLLGADGTGHGGIGTPPELDDRVRRALPAPRGAARRWAPVAAAVIGAAAAASVVTAVVVHDEPSGPTVIAVPQVDAARGVTATAGLVDHTWGLEIKLEASGLRAGETFRMWIVADDGRQYDAGGMVGVAGATITCDLSSSVLLDDAASFRVVDSSGAAVIAADVPS